MNANLGRRMLPLLLALFGTTATPSAAAGPERLVVRDLVGKGVDQFKADLLTQMLIADLQRTGKYTVYSREEIQQILDQAGSAQKLGAECDTTRCILDFGAAMNAERVVSGSVGKLGTQHIITLTLYNIAKGERESSISRPCACTEDDLIGAVTGMGRELLGLETPAVRERESGSPGKTPAPAMPAAPESKPDGGVPKNAAAGKSFVDIFLSLNKANFWTYESSSSVKIVARSSSTIRPGEREQFNGQEAFYYTVQHSASDTQFKSYYLKRDDGIHEAGGSSTGMTAMGRSSAVTINQPPYLVYPNDLAIGKQWVANYTALVESSGITTNKNPVRVEMSSKVTRRETITVPAGTFDCFVIEGAKSTTISGKYGATITGVITTWFAPGVGTIRTKDESRINDTPVQSESVLKEYHIQE